MTAHTCHWTGCSTAVPPKLWGCAKHWFALPVAIRKSISTAYRPGQEITKNPSAEYLAAAQKAQDYIKWLNTEVES